MARYCFAGRLGISAYALMVFERDTYHPVCIQHPTLWHPRTFKGKVGLKVSHKQLSSAGHATGPSPRGSLGPGARQDKSRHKPTSKVSWSVLHCGASPPTPTCLPTGHQPPTTTTGQPQLSHSGWASMGQQGVSLHCLQPFPPWHHPPVPAQRHPPPWAQA